MSEKEINKLIQDLRQRVVEGLLPQGLIDNLNSITGDSNPNIKKESDEILSLVNIEGQPVGINAPRYICHLLGLRHTCAHLMVFWTNSKGKKFLILQTRNWDKFNYPGKLDISIGGHVVEKYDSYTTLIKEMYQELGLKLSYFRQNKINHITSYLHQDTISELGYYNREWRELYIGEIMHSEFLNIHFNDKEVIGISIYPASELKSLLKNKLKDIAPALSGSLPYYFETLNTKK